MDRDAAWHSLIKRWKRHGLLFVAHAVALFPLARIVWDYVLGHFWVDPVREIITRTGRAALWMLLLSLACTPLRVFYRSIMRLRRPLGLYAFLYAALHLLTFAAWDYGLNPTLIWRAIFYQRFVIVGFLAFVILLILAITSTRGWQQRLGKYWQWLHRTVYLAAFLVIVHFVWLRKEPREPLRYGAVLLALLLLRIPPVRKGMIAVRKAVERALRKT